MKKQGQPMKTNGVRPRLNPVKYDLDFFYPVKYCSAVRSADLTGQVLPPVFNWVNPLESIYLPLKTPQI